MLLSVKINSETILIAVSLLRFSPVIFPIPNPFCRAIKNQDSASDQVEVTKGH